MLKIIAFDLNKTLIKENSWYDLNIAMGITPQEDELLYRLGPEGEGILSYAEWIGILTRMMTTRGKATRHNIDECLLNFTYLDGAQDTVAVMQDKGFKVGLITGALSPIADKVATDLALDFSYCNAEMRFDENDKLQAIELHGEDFAAKVDAVNELRKKYPNANEIYYVADGDTDEAIFRVTKGIMVDVEQNLHESWKREAIQDGEKFSAHRATKAAWRVVNNIRVVPELV